MSPTRRSCFELALTALCEESFTSNLHVSQRRTSQYLAEVVLQQPEVVDTPVLYDILVSLLPNKKVDSKTQQKSDE
jgi:hypothetical protein